MRLFLGDNYLRLKIPPHFASDDMDEAFKGNIRNLKQTARELIAREEGALHRSLALGESAVQEVKGDEVATNIYSVGRCRRALDP